MRLRPKVLLIVGSLLTTLFVLIFFVLSTFLLRDFAQLEEEQSLTTMQSARQVFDRRVLEIANKLKDWAIWDDSYQFVQDANTDFVDSNLQQEALDVLQIDLMGFVRNDGTIVMLAERQANPFAASAAHSLSTELRAHPELLPHVSQDDETRGVLMLSEGPLAYAAHAITSSDKTATPAGTIFFARLIDVSFVKGIEEIIPLKFTFFPPHDGAPAEYRADIDHLASAHLVHVTALDNKVLAGYALIEDYFGEPALILRTEMERAVYARGEKIVFFFAILLLGLGAGFTLLTFGLLEFLILRRLSSLERDVNAIGHAEDSGTRLPVPKSRDEFEQLSREINRMLETLETLGRKQAASDSQLRLIADITSIMIWMSGPDSKATYFNKGWLDFTGGRLEDMLGKGWTNYLHPDDLEPVYRITDPAVERREPFQVEYRLHRHDGEYRWILANGKPYFREHEFQGYIGSAIDINERKLNEDRDREIREETEKMNQLMVARELKMVELKDKVKALEAKLEQKASADEN